MNTGQRPGRCAMFALEIFSVIPPVLSLFNPPKDFLNIKAPRHRKFPVGAEGAAREIQAITFPLTKSMGFDIRRSPRSELQLCSAQ